VATAAATSTAATAGEEWSAERVFSSYGLDPSSGKTPSYIFEKLSSDQNQIRI